MSDPITAMAVGAAIGGGTSLARGKGFGSALQSAAIGGALGGGGSYLGGLMSGAGAGATSGGSGLLSGFKGVEAAAPSFAGGGYAGAANAVAPATLMAAPVSAAAPAGFVGSNGELVPNLLSQAPYTGGVDSLSNIGSYGSNMGSPYTPEVIYNSQFAGAAGPNFTPVLGKSADYTGGGAGSGGLFGSVKDMFGGLSTSDKLGLGLKGIDIAMRPEERMPPPSVTPIRQGNPDMVSTSLYNVAPNVGRQAGNEIGLPNLISRMPLTEEEKYRLQQAAQQGYRG